MALGERETPQQEFWIATDALAKAPGHPFYKRLNGVLADEKFDGYVEALCAKFYAEGGRPGQGFARPLDALAHPAAHRLGNAPGSLRVHFETAGQAGFDRRQNSGDRRDDIGSERGAAQHRAAGHGREVPGVSDAAGPGVRDRDADA